VSVNVARNGFRYESQQHLGYDGTMKYFPLLYRLEAEDRYLIWISNEKDFVVVGPEGLVPTFKHMASVQAYADLNNYSLEREEPILHDLDWVATWTKAPDAPVDCRKALAAWNLFSDVAKSISERGISFDRLDSQFPGVYDKLFWGNNLPSVTPSGRHYEPAWSQDELAALTEVLSAGLAMFASCLGGFPHDP
jgi:hypothetical protein